MDEMYLIPMQQQMSAARRELRECMHTAADSD